MNKKWREGRKVSYTIEYNKQVFYIEKDNQKFYFLFVRRGDNNVRDADTNLRSKSWYLVAKGTEKELWKEIGKKLGSVEGGTIQKAKGWEDTEWYTAEEYIKQYRSKIKNAKPLDTMLNSFNIEAYIYLREEIIADNPIAQTLRELISKYEIKSKGLYLYDKTKTLYPYRIQDSSVLEEFLLKMPLAYTDDFHSGFHIEKERKKRWY